MSFSLSNIMISIFIENFRGFVRCMTDYLYLFVHDSIFLCVFYTICGLGVMTNEIQ